MKRTRTLIPVAIAAALLLSGCSTGGNTDAKDGSGAECLPSGTVSSAVKVSGEVGEDLKLTSKTPVSVKKNERSVLKDGKGSAPKDGDSIGMIMTVFSGVDGKKLQESPESTVPMSKKLSTWAYEAVRCAVPDQEIAFVAQTKEVTGGEDPASFGLEGVKNDDTLIMVMKFGKVIKGEDIADDGAASSEPGTLDADKLLKKAEGKAKKAPEGFPTVKLDKDGAPTITMPKGVDAPKELEIATLIEGDGETVEPGDRVYVNYRGVIWRTGEEFDSSWSRGTATDFTTDGVIGGFRDALEGQKVGSQVIAVVPAGADKGGYPAETLKQQGHEADDVMVFVLDVLGVVHAKK